MKNAAPAPNVERFAQLCALLDDGFTARTDVLAAAGFDEAAWQGLRAEWLPRLASSDSPGLAQHFGRAYARARHHPGYLALPEPIAEDDTDVDAPPTAPETDPTEGTVAGSFPLAGPALPFRVPPLLPLAPAPAEPVPCRPAPTAADPTESTLEVPCAPLQVAAALPFSSLTPNGRRQRLQRFDTQTGQPLTTPVWVDDPTPAR